MACPEFETQVLDYLENQLTGEQRSAVASHLAVCAACRDFARALRELDASLARRLTAPALSPGFEERLRHRLEAHQPPVSEQQRAARKRQLEREFEDAERMLRGASRWGFGLLDGVGLLVAVSLAGVMLFQLSPGLADLGAGLHLNASALTLLPASLAGAACLLAGLAVAFRPALRRLALSA
jgi:hypothetical protein